jgi:hypothetical protein
MVSLDLAQLLVAGFAESASPAHLGEVTGEAGFRYLQKLHLLMPLAWQLFSPLPSVAFVLRQCVGGRLCSSYGVLP